MITKTTTYTYDNNGNELTETVNDELKVTNTYNSKNELIKTVSDKEINYTYNPEGKRIEKQDNEKIIKYVYEGLDIILELDSNNNVIANNVYGLSLISRNSDKKGYYLYNGHGDTVTIVDNEQNEIKSYTYDEWGSIIEEVGEYDNPYRYAGYYYDEETGNYYLLSRYYNPSIARFIVEDSYRGELDDPLSLNRYVYVVNNPLIYIDPEGNIPISFITGGIGGIWSGGSKIVSNIMNGKDWHEGVAGATIEGAITGFAIGTCGIKCAGIGNYIGNVSGQAVESWSTTGQIKINQKEAITHSVTTQVGAMVFGNPGMSYNYNIGEYISYYTLKGGITAASADMTYQFLDKGIIVDENNNIKGYDIESAINNYDITQTLKSGTIGAISTPVIMGTSEYIVNKISNPSSFGAMNKADAAGYKNYWKQVKQGLTTEQRYNLQTFGTTKTFADYMTLDDVANYDKYWQQVKQGLTAEQRYNYNLYGDIEGSLNYNIITIKGRTIPINGEPGTIFRKIDNNGIMQDRIIGKSSKAFKDIDFWHQDSNRTHIFTHEHWYNWTLGKGVNPRSIPNHFIWEHLNKYKNTK